jgi:protein-disulfide isomerase
MARKSRISANVVLTIAIVVLAVLVIGGVLLFNRSEGGERGSGGEIPTELRASADSNTLTTAPGNEVTVVEFLDYQCPACAAYHQNITRRLVTDYAGRITFVTRNFPLENHPLAQPAARAAEAAARQGKYREMYHALYDNHEQWAVTDDGQRLSDDAEHAATLFDRYATEIGLDLDRFHTDLDSAEVRERIDADVVAGERVGVHGTPTIFVNGNRFEPTGKDFTDANQQLRQQIDRELP